MEASSQRWAVVLFTHSCFDRSYSLNRWSDISYRIFKYQKAFQKAVHEFAMNCSDMFVSPYVCVPQLAWLVIWELRTHDNQSRKPEWRIGDRVHRRRLLCGERLPNDIVLKIQSVDTSTLAKTRRRDGSYAFPPIWSDMQWWKNSIKVAQLARCKQALVRLKTRPDAFVDKYRLKYELREKMAHEAIRRRQELLIRSPTASVQNNARQAVLVSTCPVVTTHLATYVRHVVTSAAACIPSPRPSGRNALLRSGWRICLHLHWGTLWNREPEQSPSQYSRSTGARSTRCCTAGQIFLLLTTDNKFFLIDYVLAHFSLLYIHPILLFLFIRTCAISFQELGRENTHL